MTKAGVLRLFNVKERKLGPEGSGTECVCRIYGRSVPMPGDRGEVAGLCGRGPEGEGNLSDLSCDGSYELL